MLTPLQKLLKNVRDLGKLIVAKGFKRLPKVQKIAPSGHTASKAHVHFTSKPQFRLKLGFCLSNAVPTIMRHNLNWPN